ncbi:MAG: zinc-ribbon domain-containing protein, partial [Hyphomicrobiales bacterium]|nr:zinc-ribbon domain-containing protein [Hyphomicrobiales bacterium]
MASDSQPDSAMILLCPSCDRAYAVDAARLVAAGGRVRCSS